jgi:hypothetical protein
MVAIIRVAPVITRLIAPIHPAETAQKHPSRPTSGYVQSVVCSVKRSAVAPGLGVRIIGAMPDSPPPASIIVPTFREAPNIKPLVERTFAALRNAGRPAELIIVDDDSQDGTEEAVAALQDQ